MKSKTALLPVLALSALLMGCIPLLFETEPPYEDRDWTVIDATMDAALWMREQTLDAAERWDAQEPDWQEIWEAEILELWEDELSSNSEGPGDVPRLPRPDPRSPWQGYTCNRCIKGNTSYDTGEKIYHFPGCEYYQQTVINTDYGERWFSSEAEAQAAGWRKAQNCP